VPLLEAVRARGEAVREELEARMAQERELVPAKERKRLETEWGERVKRARRRHERVALDLGLQLVSLWLFDLAARSWGAEDLVRNVDRQEQLAGCAGPGSAALLRGIELVEETRARFLLNVSEELACEALAYRLEHVLTS
jgi:DNA polymerase-3 subunit delta'